MGKRKECSPLSLPDSDNSLKVYALSCLISMRNAGRLLTFSGFVQSNPSGFQPGQQLPGLLQPFSG